MSVPSGRPWATIAHTMLGNDVSDGIVGVPEAATLRAVLVQSAAHAPSSQRIQALQGAQRIATRKPTAVWRDDATRSIAPARHSVAGGADGGDDDVDEGEGAGTLRVWQSSICHRVAMLTALA